MLFNMSEGQPAYVKNAIFYFDDAGVANVTPFIVGGESSIKRLSTDGSYRSELDLNIRKRNSIMKRAAKAYFWDLERNPEKCSQYALNLHAWLNDPKNAKIAKQVSKCLEEKVNLNIEKGVINEHHSKGISEGQKVLPPELYSYLVYVAKKYNTTYNLAANSGNFIAEEEMLINAAVTAYLANKMALRSSGYYPTSDGILELASPSESEKE